MAFDTVPDHFRDTSKTSVPASVSPNRPGVGRRSSPKNLTR